MAKPTLEEWQASLFREVTRPLPESGLPAADRSEAELKALVKGTPALDALARIEIYNRMYWARTLDSLAEDFPGVRSYLGSDLFSELCQRYIRELGSRSYTLRDLGRRLAAFIATQRNLLGDRKGGAFDLARYEWAQVHAFDGKRLPPLGPESFAGIDPAEFRLRLQPYITLLTVTHPVGEYVSEAKSDGTFRGATSNAKIQDTASQVDATRELLPRTRPIFLAVHRLEGTLYFKVLDRPAARLLRALARGTPLQPACELAFLGETDDAEVQAEQIQEWFASWMRMGWLCPAE